MLILCPRLYNGMFAGRVYEGGPPSASDQIASLPAVKRGAAGISGRVCPGASGCGKAAGQVPWPDRAVSDRRSAPLSLKKSLLWPVLRTQQVNQRNPHRSSQCVHDIQPDIAAPTLNLGDIRPVHLDRVSDVKSRQPPGLACGPQILSEYFAQRTGWTVGLWHKPAWRPTGSLVQWNKSMVILYQPEFNFLRTKDSYPP